MRSIGFIYFLVFLVISANGDSCRDDSYFRYGGTDTYEDDNGKDCKDWVARYKSERCELSYKDVHIKTYCPNTCALTRIRGTCGKKGKGIQIEKCLDNEWVDAICIEDCQDDTPQTNPPTEIFTNPPTKSPIKFDCTTDPNRPADIKQVLETVSNQLDLGRPSSYQFQAYSWIVNNDGRRLCADDESLLQRYILTLIYSMGGDQWDRAETFGNYKIATPECSWYGVTCINDTVVNLIFSGINMSGSIPVEIGKLKRLQKLNFENNLITGKIPDTIGMLSTLTNLDLDRNLMTGTLPNSIYYLPNLIWLDIDNNQISGTISNKIGELSAIEVLSLWNCNFSGTIPEEISKLQYLQDLSLDGNNLSGSVPQSLCDLRSGNGSLEFIATDCNGSPPKVVCTCCDKCYPEV